MIIFVGDKPSPRMKPGAKPFEGAACEPRLRSWIQYVLKPKDKSIESTTYEILNQINQFRGQQLDPHHKWIALGNSAAEYLKQGNVPFFKLPHPSGRNRQINDKEFIAKKLEECRQWLNSK